MRREEEQRVSEERIAQQRAQLHAPPIVKAIPPHLQCPIPSTQVSSQGHQSQTPLGDYITTRQVLTDEEAKRSNMRFVEGLNQKTKEERAERFEARPKPPPPVCQNPEDIRRMTPPQVPEELRKMTLKTPKALTEERFQKNLQT